MSTLAPPAPTPPSLMVPVYGGGAEATAARGSYGPVIAMLVVVVVLAAAAVAVGRLCFGRRALGHAGGHDLEAWVERTCGPCVGAPAKDDEGGGGGGNAAAAAEHPPERTTTEREEASSSGGGA
ncbi:hypothetical protein ACP4OV_029875 [Aristida adscensionis]